MIDFRATLLRIIGRIKRHMDAIFLTMGGILIPLGFYLKIEYPQADNAGTASVIVGLAMWLLAYFYVKRKEARDKTEKRAEKQAERIERQENQKLLQDILQELKRLGGDKK